MNVNFQPMFDDALARERDRFREMFGSDLFDGFMVRIRHELARSTAACTRLDEPRDIWRAQGAAQALEGIVRLPAAMLEEMEKAGKNADLKRSSNTKA